MSYLSDFLMIPLPGATVSGDNLFWSKDIAQFTLVSTSELSSESPIINLVNSMPGVGNGGLIRWYSQNSTPASTLAALIKGSFAVNNEGAESGKLDFVVPVDGAGRMISFDGSLSTFGSDATGSISLGADTARWAGVAIGNVADTYKGDFAPDVTNLGIAVSATSTHPLLLKANSIVGLRIESTGLVTVGTPDGTAQVTLSGTNLVVGATGYTVYARQTLPASMTTLYGAFHSAPTTTASAYTLTELDHFKVSNVTLGASSVLTTQVGLKIGSLSGATNNYGLKLEVASGTNNYNIYASGTAKNYFAGVTEFDANVRLGSSALTTTSTAGFPYLAAVAGTMTGVPTAMTGAVPIMVDSTLFKIGMYVSGAWKWSAAFT